MDFELWGFWFRVLRLRGLRFWGLWFRGCLVQDSQICVSILDLLYLEQFLSINRAKIRITDQYFLREGGEKLTCNHFFYYCWNQTVFPTHFCWSNYHIYCNGTSLYSRGNDNLAILETWKKNTKKKQKGVEIKSHEYVKDDSSGDD